MNRPTYCGKPAVRDSPGCDCTPLNQICLYEVPPKCPLRTSSSRPKPLPIAVGTKPNTRNQIKQHRASKMGCAGWYREQDLLRLPVRTVSCARYSGRKQSRIRVRFLTSVVISSESNLLEWSNTRSVLLSMKHPRYWYKSDAGLHVVKEVGGARWGKRRQRNTLVVGRRKINLDCLLCGI